MPEGTWLEYLWLFLKIGLVAFGPYLLIAAGSIWLLVRHLA